ncbi:hypothetical protein [Streptomyces sp. NPDC060035]|uniref:hypothetical protein n=1 Tax=Streptomyces sp. NPDC060035 TaxID=3347044 RepID=UPI0036D078A1
MPTSASLRSRGARTGTAVAAAVAAAGLTLAGAPAAHAIGGELDVQPVERPSHSPSPTTSPDGLEVCAFKVVASNFGELPAVVWTITTQPSVIPPGLTLTGTVALAQGIGEAPGFQLPEGIYVLTWNAPGPKSKTFKVDCSKKEGHYGSKNEWKHKNKEEEEGSSWSGNGESGNGESGRGESGRGESSSSESGGSASASGESSSSKEYSKPSGAVPAGGGGVPTMETVGSENDSNLGTTTALAAGAAGLAGLVLVRRQARRRTRGEA